MKQYTDHIEWEKAMRNAEMELKEITVAKPDYYNLYERMTRLQRDNWQVKRMTPSMTGPTMERMVDVFYETMERWCRLDFEDSQKLWELVKKHSDAPKNSFDWFDVKKMYNTMKTIRDRLKSNKEKV